MTSPNELWCSVLNDLRLQMPKASFDHWLRPTQALEVEDGRLVVGAPNVYAIDWLSQRLGTMINRAVAGAAGREMVVEFALLEASPAVGVSRVTEADLHQAELFIQGVHRDEYNVIVRPDRVFVGTQYFRRAWLPLLGPTTWTLILELRQRCYRNLGTGEIRDECQATYADLAAAVGVSERTVKRALNPEREPKRGWVELFIPCRQILRRYSARQGREVNQCVLWRVALDDPLAPDDEKEFSKCQNDP